MDSVCGPAKVPDCDCCTWEFVALVRCWVAPIVDLDKKIQCLFFEGLFSVNLFGVSKNKRNLDA